jgi:hypothetical protein
MPDYILRKPDDTQRDTMSVMTDLVDDSVSQAHSSTHSNTLSNTHYATSPRPKQVYRPMAPVIESIHSPNIQEEMDIREIISMTLQAHQAKNKQKAYIKQNTNN